LWVAFFPNTIYRHYMKKTTKHYWHYLWRSKSKHKKQK
jgi:hypothetical protein